MVKRQLNNLFSSLSDTTRRDILQRLSLGELTVSQIAETYNMSLPAVSKHLKVLEEAKLIVKEKRGRQYYVHLTPLALQDASEHLQYYETVLSSRIDSLRSYLRKEPLAKHEKTPSRAVNKQQELVTTSVLDGDPEKVWQAYTDTESIKAWWNSPNTLPVKFENDVRVGGHWRFVLGSTDGNIYTFSGTYKTVLYPHLLEYTDGTGMPNLPRPEAHITISLKPFSEGKTLFTKRSVATPAVHQLNAAWLKAAGVT